MNQSHASEPLLLIISSPSGAGKTTLTHRLLDQFGEQLAFSISHTTRAPRPNEVDGQDYHFIDHAAFRARIAEGQFAEWAEVHGNLYGTSVGEIERARRAGRRVLLFDVDYQGARQIKAKRPEAVGVFILPPSMSELRRRLESRGTESPESLERRYAKAKEEIEHYPFFDYLVLNDDLQQALAELRGIIHAELCRRRRLAP
ncbi:MAG TPA: guanylate kinase, partial [Polyangiaceae bacterium LLY-WYZ-15_(1-7)]|nr:guanylate kinase [Polyangiaceae bacterium LLY-WYZ-15_(1-7)]HJL44537.1 guanylate kinase [Polyangiaceae bacterium LLY-WYZ-15_(1-7)]